MAPVSGGNHSKAQCLRGSSTGSVAIIWMQCSRVLRKEFSFRLKMVQRSLRLHEYALTMFVEAAEEDA